jgi:hypothetical protein
MTRFFSSIIFLQTLLGQSVSWERTASFPVQMQSEAYLSINADTLGNLFYGNSSGLFISTNDGESWEQKKSSNVSSIIVTPGQDVYYMDFFGSIMGSYNHGFSWQSYPQVGFYSSNVFAVCSRQFFFGKVESINEPVKTYRLQKGVNGGGGGTVIINVFPTYQYPIHYLYAVQNNALLLTGGLPFSRVWKTTDEGNTWNDVSLGIPDSVNCYQFAGNGSAMVYCITDKGVYRSDENGTNWKLTSIPSFPFIKLAVQSNGNVYAILDSSKILFSQNNGDTYTILPSFGLPSSDSRRPTYYLHVNKNGRLFATFYDNGYVYRSTGSPLVIRNNSNPAVAPQFILEQNYPNPFNPATTILFSIPDQTALRLTIFDSVGREVATIAEGEFAAGNYKRVWETEGVPSGIYFYRLQTMSFSQTKKLLLLK